MKGKIIGYDAKGPNGIPVIMVEFSVIADDENLPLNKEVVLSW